MNSRKFLCISSIVFITTFFLYYIAFTAQLGANVKAEWWASDLHAYKMNLIKKEKNKKIIIVGGSNALFGIDSSIMSEALKMPVYNLGVHYLLPELQFLDLQEVVNQGDIVIGLFEFEIFTSEFQYSDWFTNNIMAWGQKSYLEKVDILNYLKFLSSVEPKRIVDGLQVIIRSNEEKTSELKKIIQFIDAKAINDNKFYGYSYKSMNKNGDFLIESSLHDSDSLSPKNPIINMYENNKKITNYSIDFFKRLKDLVEMKGGELFLTYPTILESSKFSKKNLETHKAVKYFYDQIKQEGIEILCDPFDFTFKRKYFYDSKYHLKKIGAQLRTKSLLSCYKKNVNLNHL